MIATALLPLMFVNPAAAEDPTPVSAPLVEMVISSGEVGELCAAYSELMGLYQTSGMTDPVFVEVADAYVIVQMEGDTLRLLPDARDALTTYLHSSCS